MDLDYNQAPEGDESKTALIPIDFFQGKSLKPGAECKVRVSRILDGQAEVTYLSSDEGQEELDEIPEQSGDDEMAGLMNA